MGFKKGLTRQSCGGKALPTVTAGLQHAMDDAELRVLRLTYLCHGGASPQRSSPEGPGVESKCPGCNPPDAVSSKLKTGT